MDDKSQKTIADYVGDIVALESHIEEAMDRQMKLAADSGSATATKAITGFHDMVRSHKRQWMAYQEEIGTTAGNPVIEVGANLLGKAAGLIDMVRTEGVSKALRDDYTAFNHACISHTMLNATALALGDSRTATLSETSLTDYARAVQEINRIMGEVVVWELEKDNHTITDRNAAQQNRKMVDQAWKAGDSDSK